MTHRPHKPHKKEPCPHGEDRASCEACYRAKVEAMRPGNAAFAAQRRAAIKAGTYAPRQYNKMPAVVVRGCCTNPHCFVCAGTNRALDLVKGGAR
jgi:hypothetical protein